MRKIIHYFLGHDWRWVIAYERIICARCGKEFGGTIADWVRYEEGPKRPFLKSI